jgi:hypothetical protein
MGWTVRGSNPCRDEIFYIYPDRPCGPPNALYNDYPIIVGDKSVGAWRNHPPLSSAEVKERVELYVYSPSVVYMAPYRVSFIFFTF